MVKRNVSFAVVVLAAAICVGAQRNEEQPRSRDAAAEDRAVQLLRTVNTAEMLYRRATGRYGSIQEAITYPAVADRLRHDPQRSRLMDEILATNDSPSPNQRMKAIIKDTEYSVLITQTSRSGEVAFFTTESGLIFRGAAIE